MRLFFVYGCNLCGIILIEHFMRGLNALMTMCYVIIYLEIEMYIKDKNIRKYCKNNSFGLSLFNKYVTR